MLSIFFDEAMDKDFCLTNAATNQSNNSSSKSTTTALTTVASSTPSSGTSSSLPANNFSKNNNTYSNTVYSSYSMSMDPKEVFVHENISFWGTSKANLDKLDLSDKDLIINCTGVSYDFAQFVKKTPTWLSLDTSDSLISQLVLEWKDFGIPPKSWTEKHWLSIFSQAKENGINRIICCCQAGQGRTGTALGAFYGLLKKPEEKENIIKFIRNNYSSKAIENIAQERYLLLLINATEEEINKIIKPVTTTSNYQTYNHSY